MPPAPEAGLADLRLWQLLRRYRAEVEALALALADRQADLDHWQREAALARFAGRDDAAALLARSRVAQEECDALALELAHARLAVEGAAAELAAARQQLEPIGDVA